VELKHVHRHRIQQRLQEGVLRVDHQSDPGDARGRALDRLGGGLKVQRAR